MATAWDPAESPLPELDDVPPDDQTGVARKIRGLMGENQISQQRLAKATGLSSRGMSERLNGKANFTIRELYRIARAFRVSIFDLFPPEQRGLFDARTFFRDLYNEVVLDVTRTNRPPATQLAFRFDDGSDGYAPSGREDAEASYVTHKEAA